MIITQEVFMEIRNLESFIQVAALQRLQKVWATPSPQYPLRSVSWKRSLASLCLNGSTTESGLQKKEKRF